MKIKMNPESKLEKEDEGPLYRLKIKIVGTVEVEKTGYEEIVGLPYTDWNEDELPNPDDLEAIIKEGFKGDRDDTLSVIIDYWRPKWSFEFDIERIDK